VHFWELGVHFGNLPGVLGERGSRGPLRRVPGSCVGSPDGAAGRAPRTVLTGPEERPGGAAVPAPSGAPCTAWTVARLPQFPRDLYPRDRCRASGQGRALEAVGGGVARREVKGVKGPQVLSLRGVSMGGT
jgi:hypothetical protein